MQKFLDWICWKHKMVYFLLKETCHGANEHMEKISKNRTDIHIKIDTFCLTHSGSLGVKM